MSDWGKRKLPSKIISIQISRASDFWNGSTETIIALCEDGSIWRLIKECNYISTYIFWKPITLDIER